MTQEPINYANWQTIQPKKFGRGIFGWVLFIGLAVMLFLLLNKPSNKYTSIPLSAFQERLADGAVMSVTIQGDEVIGTFRSSQAVMGVGNVTDFRVALPAGTGTNWEFVHWLLENRKDATVQVDNNSNLLVNILTPLVPWLLIFGFIWFFVFRQLRNISSRPPQPVYLIPPPPGQPIVNLPPPPISGGPQV